VVGAPERLTGDDLLGFVRIEPATVLAIPKAQQFAEKVHAYTFPWAGRVNTRTRDSVDLVLLIERGALEAGQIREALAATFTTRGTHERPAALPPPPGSWEDEFAGMATEANLTTTDYLVAFRILDEFWTRNGLGPLAASTVRGPPARTVRPPVRRAFRGPRPLREGDVLGLVDP
jgi:hypothetical protein